MTAKLAGLCPGTGPGLPQLRCHAEGCTCFPRSSQAFEDESAIEMELGDTVIFSQAFVIERECSVWSMNDLGCS